MKRKPDTKLGEILEIQPEEEYGSGFRKVRFIIATPGAYSQELIFELHHEKADIISAYQTGDFVKVFYDIKGNRGSDGKHYTNLIAWRLECAE
jgi:single-strand DNA-binding protein|tara:strand:- start:3145 stop:3423 length:279 start_codon:yes stop_codon:yes gene_type:complete